MRVGVLQFMFRAGQTEQSGKINFEAFRPFSIVTNVQEPGSVINGLYLKGGQNELLMPMDCYAYSLKLWTQQVQQFLEEHGLVGKSDEEVQAYCDERDIGMPHPPRLVFPTLRQGETIRITGQFQQATMVALQGYVP